MKVNFLACFQWGFTAQSHYFCAVAFLLLLFLFCIFFYCMFLYQFSHLFLLNGLEGTELFAIYSFSTQRAVHALVDPVIKSELWPWQNNYILKTFLLQGSLHVFSILPFYHIPFHHISLMSQSGAMWIAKKNQTSTRIPLSINIAFSKWT